MLIDPNKITDTRDLEFITRMMKESVSRCKKDKLFMPSLCLIACFIDGLGDGTKKNYLNNLKTHFPDLCTELGALVFYQKYRNGIVHEFDPRNGFGIARNDEIDNKYVTEVNIQGTNEKIKFLNIDLLISDFIKWIKEVRNSLPPKKTCLLVRS